MSRASTVVAGLLAACLLSSAVTVSACAEDRAAPTSKTTRLPDANAWDGSLAADGLFTDHGEHVALGEIRYGPDGWVVEREPDDPFQQHEPVAVLSVPSRLETSLAPLLLDDVIARGRAVASEGPPRLIVTSIERVSDRVPVDVADYSFEDMQRPGMHRLERGEALAVGTLRERDGGLFVEAGEGSSARPFAELRLGDAAVREMRRKLDPTFTPVPSTSTTHSENGRPFEGMPVFVRGPLVPGTGRLSTIQLVEVMPRLPAEHTIAIAAGFGLPSAWWPVPKPGSSDLPKGRTRAVGVLKVKGPDYLGRPTRQNMLELRFPEPIDVTSSRWGEPGLVHLDVSEAMLPRLDALDGAYVAVEGAALVPGHAKGAPPNLRVERVERIPVPVPPDR